METRYAILGASRGLGWNLFQNISELEPNSQFFLSSRKMKIGFPNTTAYKCDFSKVEALDDLYQKLYEFKPNHIIYTAGGGPYGFFQQQKWSSHQWAMQVNYLTPTFLLHKILEQKNFTDLKSFTFIGSAIAESKPDPKAASYSAAKHAILGLVSTLQLENTSAFKIKLFSPGYIKTSLLPEHSEPRQSGLALEPSQVAQSLFSFIKSEEVRYTDEV